MPTISDAFKAKQAKHLRLTEAYEKLQGIFSLSDGEAIYLLVGPTAAGKSSLMQRLQNDCVTHYQEAMAEDPGFIPSLLSKLISPTPRATGNQNFDWKDGFIRMLSEGNEVQIKKKAFPRVTIELDGEQVTEIHGLTPSELRRAFEGFCKGRRLRQLLLDEASHIFAAGQGSSIYHLHFEMLKSLAISLKRPLVLSGAYDLLKALELNGQLNRRIYVVHFERYTIQDLRDPDSQYGQSFINTLFTFLEWIPIPKDEGLMDSVEYFLMKSLGCVGILKEWFGRTLDAALKNPKPIFSRELLEKCALSNKRLKDILKEITLGEDLLKDIADQELAAALGIDWVPSLNVQSQTKSTDVVDASENKKPPKRPKPGKRKPGRDMVGGLKNAA